eukprot:Seg10153.1 transcript_id=Seg10153.1/GoldUCD/mRNA.D3Y31 product="hypothetical protein" protein_id=Seg10153.1/GoldUCD/D3Y31
MGQDSSSSSNSLKPFVIFSSKETVAKPSKAKSHANIKNEQRLYKYMENEMKWHADQYQFPLILKLKEVTENSCKINCDICDRWISIGNVYTKQLVHLRDHCKTPLHQSNIELQERRVSNFSGDIPKVMVNKELLQIKYPNVFDVIGMKAQCRFCLKDCEIDLLPKSGSFIERIATHLNSKLHKKMVDRSAGMAQGRLSFHKSAK